MRWSDAHRTTMVSATRAHDRFNVDLTQPVDIFAVIEAIDLILAFQPLRGLSGAYVADEGLHPGIIINSLHPPARQRYTAAHELGHHLLGHGSSVDPDIDPMKQWGSSRAVPDHEKEAEAFAAWFLMPRRLVRSVLSRLSIPKPMCANDVYSLALRLGTSYEATARQLRNLHLATFVDVHEWLSIKPRDIKIQLGGKIPNLRNDVWNLTTSEHGSLLRVRPGDRIVVNLGELPSSGYTWQLASKPAWLYLVEDDLLRTSAVRGNLAETSRTTCDVGLEGMHRFVLDVAGDTPDGQTELRLVERQAWDPTEVSNEFLLNVIVERPRRGVREERLDLSAA